MGELVAKKDNEPWSAEDKAWLSGANHKMCLDCLNAVCDDAAVIAQVQRFFQNQIRVLARALRTADEELPATYIDLVWRVFDGDVRKQRFYLKYGVAGNEKLTTNKYAIRPVCCLCGCKCPPLSLLTPTPCPALIIGRNRRRRRSKC